MKGRALILWGGWDGHEPEQVAHRFSNFLQDNDFEVEMSSSLETLKDREKLMALDLFVPVWTMGELSSEDTTTLADAVGSGVGLAGCHGGMCDAFRTNVLWQFMTGGNWVSHPGCDGVSYRVNMRNCSSSLSEGIGDFDVCSEHYYLHVDPAVEILATTRFPVVKWYHSTNGEVDVPVVWTKRWGHGRVFYNALGHRNDIFDISEAWELMSRGLLWAAEGKRLAIQRGLSIDEFASERRMY